MARNSISKVVSKRRAGQPGYTEESKLIRFETHDTPEGWKRTTVFFDDIVFRELSTRANIPIEELKRVEGSIKLILLGGRDNGERAGVDNKNPKQKFKTIKSLTNKLSKILVNELVIESLAFFEWQKFRETPEALQWKTEPSGDVKLRAKVEQLSAAREADIRAIDRMNIRASALLTEPKFILHEFDPKPGHDDLRKRIVAAGIVTTWVIFLHKDTTITRAVRSFADYLFRLVGFKLTDEAIREQLNIAVRRLKESAPHLTNVQR